MVSGFSPGAGQKTAGLIEKKLYWNLNKINTGNLYDFDCGSGFQPRSCDDGNSATFFRGWKPLPPTINFNLNDIEFYEVSYERSHWPKKRLV
jgi:hypothetical protein